LVEETDVVDEVTNTYLKTKSGKEYIDLPSVNPKFTKYSTMTINEPITNEVEIYHKLEGLNTYTDWDEDCTWNEMSDWENGGINYNVDEWVVEIHSTTKILELPTVDINYPNCVLKIIVWEKSDIDYESDITFEMFDGIHFDPNMFQISPVSNKIYWTADLDWLIDNQWQPDFIYLFDNRR
jgi:hypothetical protein